jgi:ATP-dependent DNA helicase RecG
MNNDKLKNILAIGETVAVEFKRCGNGIESDTYETVCSFLNRYGGDIFLGVEDDGEVRGGVPEKAAPDIIKNFITMINNPNIISPTFYLTPEILRYEDKTIIHIHVPVSSEVHSYKKSIYDRNNDADVKVTATSQIAALYIRKQKIFTEQKVFPYVRDDELRLDMMPRLRQMALNRHKDHPWNKMTDKEIIMSAKLYDEDKETGKKGYNLAAVMLLGCDDVILSVAPAYRTDALVRKVNLDRYDDRLIVQKNLIESYDLLIGFAEKHLWDKFYLEGDKNVSLRSIISREMLANTLIHREFTSSFYSKFVIEKDRMYTENANRAIDGQKIDPDDYRPNSKNPIIANFFRNIGLADELGSGVRRLHHYVPRYSGKPPELIDGDIFRIIVPLDDSYSYEVGKDKVQNKAQNKAQSKRNDCALIEALVLEYFTKNPRATQIETAKAIGKSRRTVQDAIAALKEKGLLERQGAKQNGRWVVLYR